MDETTLEKMLHTAADLRARLDGSVTSETQRAFLQNMLTGMEAAFEKQADQVRAIRTVLPRRNDAGGRATVAYVDRLLGQCDGFRLH
ncbi:hypothetical protein FV242_33930 [Methylobacterium sp. WL64]|uniref:hypothetical protein n=1 Tax=Methylobacterium sp. WL64 TaxID=2603894 RepID=UPI0011C8B13D|nr:hypothetical protein [Methylobacterium sp. WL64]TXM96179.1 hypothetical protein FV242_33930 [Methylobacterium sp. WL64]